MNPLVSDPFIDFLLQDVLDAQALCRLPAFQGQGEALAPWFAACRRVAREVLFPSYRVIDAEPPRFEGGRVFVHARMHDAWRELVGLGVIAGVGQLPLTVTTLSSAYLMAGNCAAYGFAGLTAGAAHLVEAFGTDALKATYLEKMQSGEWSGTMALTEPHAGSSLGDVTTRAKPTDAGHHLISGAKIFISGGDQDLTTNVVHLVLARIDGAPLGSKGISLFAVPKLRPSLDSAGGERLVANDVQVSGVIHKIGWRGLPSLALSFGDEGDCHGFLVGEPGQGLRCMFQMMNEARIMVGVNAAATASVAFHESLAYARERKQGRAIGNADVKAPQLPLTEHADVRRMLLRQKAIVEGSLALLGITARYADLATHSPDEAERTRSKLLLDLLTPIAKTFPAEKGFESNALALQIHGGYGYSSEYLPEAWLRDQKLNSIHEGTTGIQGLDLLGRKVVAGGGAALMALREELELELGRAKLDVTALRTAADQMVELTAALGARGAGGDLEGMLGHSADFMEALSLVVVGWVWTKVVNALGSREDDFAKGLRAAAEYWQRTELPRVPALAKLCESAERSYLDLRDGWLG
ncbi:MAG: acyl-CoA dehydrogenase [Archangium sp.]|nr:acyl-CoA dehydrogenase [Archangium sp.]